MSEWSPLARGGLAVVWQARQLSLSRLVAVKVYQSALDEDGRRRFLREAAAASRLSNHPGIVTAHDAGILPDGRPYLIMELYGGGSLTKWLRPDNRPSEETVRQVGSRIADALAAAHACGVLHRDVKPANILIDSYGNPALGDFGLAAMTGAEAAAADALRLTPAYAPPEAFAMQAAEAGDVYALAATLYALLGGRPPEKPIDQLPGVGQHFMEVLTTALSDDPAARPTAAKLRDQLAVVPVNRTASNGDRAAVLAVTADSLPASDQVASVEAPQRRGRRRETILALAAALVTVIGSATAWMINEPPSPSSSTAIAPSGLPSSAGPSPVFDDTGSGSGELGAISVQGPAASAKPFQTVRIEGMYRGGEETLLQVQLWEGGQWLAFPLLAKTDKSGRFTAYVEVGEPGRYRLRVLDPGTDVTSQPSELVVSG